MSAQIHAAAAQRSRSAPHQQEPGGYKCMGAATMQAWDPVCKRCHRPSSTHCNTRLRLCCERKMEIGSTLHCSGMHWVLFIAKPAWILGLWTPALNQLECVTPQPLAFGDCEELVDAASSSSTKHAWLICPMRALISPWTHTYMRLPIRSSCWVAGGCRQGSVHSFSQQPLA